MDNYGRNRQSIADIQAQLYSIFNQHPNSHLNGGSEPVIPADALVDVLLSFSDAFDGVPLLSDEELDMLKTLLSSNPGLEVTPSILLSFIAEKTKASPPRTPDNDELDLPPRGRDKERDDYDHQRSSSNESNTGYFRSSSRPPSRGPPQTPGSAKSPFDAERRQRSTPLTANAPSSWSRRPTPAHRRKSDAGSRSDSESCAPSSFNRSTGRVRAPSNPTSPSTSALDLSSFSPIGSPTFSGPRSRPPSRQLSQSAGYGPMHFDEHGYSSPDDINATVHNRRRSLRLDESFGGLSSVPLPRSNSMDDNDSDEEASVLGLVSERDIKNSNASILDFERLEALQRQNEELNRKRMEYEEILNRKVAEHEHDYAELQGALDQLRAELSATKREEKELRSKERQNMQQIAHLEQEVAKSTKALDHSRGVYTSLQKQYQEQCAASEKYRNELREKEEKARALGEAVALFEIEKEKFDKERASYESQISQLELELNAAENTFAQLEEQKQENLLLKETIDRMRYDMDELRNTSAPGPVGGASGQSSANNTISKSLGAELAGKMNWDADDDAPLDEGNSGETIVEEGEDTEGEEEDVIQTIITRKKRKVASRAIPHEYQREFEEAKDYSDTGTQYDPTYFAVSRSMQTDTEPKILTATWGIQTEEPLVEAFAIQTDPEPVRVTCEMEIQTEATEEEAEEPSRSPSPHHIESLASSSSTVVPPTPKPTHKQFEDQDSPAVPLDQPPAYNQITHDPSWAVVADVLKKWHGGAKMPVEPVEGGISEEAVEEWKALKEELGIECMVIDKLVASSEKLNNSRMGSSSGKGKGRRSRFYNIYNTYVFGGGDKGPAFAGSLAGQAIMVAGASVLVMLAITPYMVPHYSVPGGATYYDRSAWNSFNTMQAAGEGFSPDGTAAVWNFLGRVGGGAARIARGWPT